MDNRIIDYNNYDKLHLYVKKSREERVINIYNALGYELVSNKPNRKYSNIMDLTFVRPHKIQNKNSLQYLQVCLEIELNKIGKTEKHRHSLSVSFALTMGLLSILLGGFSVFFLINSFSVLQKIINITLFFSSVIIFVLGAFLTSKIIKNENKKFKEKNDEYIKNVNEIFEDIQKIRGII